MYYLIYKGKIIATTVTTTMATKEPDDNSQIRSMGAEKFVPTLLIFYYSPPTYLHYHHHHHHYHHYYYYHHHYDTNNIYVSI